MTILEHLTPRLPVADLKRTLTFYRDLLGFAVDVLWPPDQPAFAIVAREKVSVGFFVPSDDQPATIGTAELYVEAQGVRDLHEALKQKIQIEWGPEVYSYGRREFAFRDPDGYLIIFTEPTDDPPTTHEP